MTEERAMVLDNATRADLVPDQGRPAAADDITATDTFPPKAAGHGTDQARNSVSIGVSTSSAGPRLQPSSTRCSAPGTVVAIP